MIIRQVCPRQVSGVEGRWASGRTHSLKPVGRLLLEGRRVVFWPELVADGLSGWPFEGGSEGI